MAILRFEVQADYDKVIKLRTEIANLEKQLQDMNKTASMDAVNELVQKISSSKKEFQALATAAANSGQSIVKGFKSKIDSTADTLSSLESQMQTQRATIAKTEKELEKLGNAYDEAVRKQKGNEEAKLAAYQRTQGQLEGQRAKLVQLATQHTTTASSIGQMTDAYRQFLSESGAGTQSAIAMLGRLQGLAMSVTGVYGASSFLSNMISVRGQFQQADTAIESIMGSAEKARALMSEVREYAKISPLEFSSVTNATQMMLGFNIEAQKVPKFIAAIGDVSMGNSQKFNSLTLAFSQMSAAGKLMGQDLNQMINAGFNPLQQISKTTGKSISELKEEMSKGAISAEMVQQAFIDITSEGGKFYKMSEKGSQTINGQMSMLQDNMDAMYNDLGTKAEGFIIKAIGGATDLIGHYKEIGKTLAVVATAFGTYKAAMMAATTMDKSQEKSVLDAQLKGVEQAINNRQKQMGMKLTDFTVKVDNKSDNDPLREALEMRKKELELIEQERLTRKAFAEADAAGYDDILEKQRELQALRDENNRDHSDLKEAQLHTQVFSEGDEEYADALKFIDERKKKEEELAESVEAAKARMLKPYKDELDISQELVDEAQARVDAALEGRDAEEYQAASIELKTATERRDTAQTKLNTMEQNVNNATKARSAAANEAHALAENADTAATTRNTTASKANSFQEVLATAKKNAHTIATRIGTTAQTMYGNAIKQVTASLQAMKVALLTNPITAIATIAMTAASAFYMFADSAEEASEESKRFGESASKSIRDLDSLVMTMKGVDASSQTYKDAMGELNKVLEEYGVELIKEGDSIDAINKKREEAIELIKLEGIERERANHIDQGQQEYGEKVSKAQASFKEALEDVEGEFGENASAISNILQNVVEENAAKLIGKTGQEYAKQMREIRQMAKDRLIASGISKEEVDRQMRANSSLGSSFSTYVNAVKNAKRGLDDYVKLTDKAADAERKAAQSALTAGQKYAIFKKKIEGADGTVDTLYKNIAKLMRDYNNNTIHFKIDIDGKVPAWMKNIKVDKLKELAVRFASLADQHAGRRVYMGGRMWTEQELRQRSMDYANAAKQAEDSITPEEDKKRKRQAVLNARKKKQKAKTSAERDAADTEEKNAEKAYKAVNDGKTLAQEEKDAQKNNTKGETEAAKRARQQKKYNDILARQKEERIKSIKDLASSTAQAEVDALAEGEEKTLRQMRLDAKKKDDALDAEIEAFKKKKVDNARALWEADPANMKAIEAGQTFDESGVDTKLSAEEEKYVAKKREANNAALAKAELEHNKTQIDAMRSYLKEYGTYQQQKLAIAEEYADKIAKATTEGERMALSASRDKALADVDLREFKDSINWEQVFGNLQYQTKEQLEKLKGQLRDYLNSSDLGADEYKSVAEQIDKINSAIVDEEQRHANILNWELPTLGEKKKLMMEAEESQKRLNDLTQRQIGLNMAVTASRTSISANLQRMGFNVNPGEVTSDNAQSILSKVGNAYGTDSKQYKEVAAAMDKLTNEERKLTDATKKQSQAAEDYKNKQSALSKYLGDFRNKLKEVSEAFEHVNKNLQSLPDLTQALGLDSNSGLGKAAQGIADTSNYAMGAMQDFASGNYLGAAAKGINAVNSLGETLGFWSNSNKADVEEENNRLVEAGKNLEVAMDKLTKQMQKGSASEAAKTYEEAKKMLKTQSENERAKMQNNARMYDGGHSLNYDFNEMFEGSSLAKRLTQFLGVSVRTLQDITSLDATKLEKLTESDKGRQLWKELNDMLLEAQDDGNYNGMADDLRNYITNYGKEAYEKLEEQFKSFVTGTSLDSFKDSFKSALADMDRSSQDFASDFTKQLTQSVINAQIEKKFNEKMTRLYDRWNTAVSGDDWIDENELNDLRQQESELVQEMIAERNRIREAIGYDAATTASSGSFQGMSQDTGNELNGRFTALQAAGERIDAATAEQTKNILQMNVTLGELAGQTTSLVSIADDTRDILANSYMELQEINLNTQNTVKALATTNERLQRIENKL